MKNYINSYSNFLKSFLRIKRPLKVVFDCSNGTAGKVLSGLFRKSKVTAVLINCRPDGNFPGHGPNPLAKGAVNQLQAIIKKSRRKVGTPTPARRGVGADLGVIFDADADRVFFIDNLSRHISADKAGYILMKGSKPPFIVSIVSGWLLKKWKGKRGKGKVYLSRVGHYFFKKIMRKKKANLGLELTGHYYFKDFFYCDSGILAAVKFINFVSRLDGKLSDYLDGLPKYYRSAEMNFKVRDKEKIIKRIEKEYKKRTAKIIKLDGLTMKFGPPAGGWWFNVRLSRTENLLRLNIEATNKKTLQRELKTLKNLIKKV